MSPPPPISHFCAARVINNDSFLEIWIITESKYILLKFRSTTSFILFLSINLW